MSIITVTGVGGGVGSTTVVGQLASILAARNHPVLAIDLAQQNTLRLHFGMHWQDGNGLAPHVLARQPWHKAGYRCENGVEFLPFGKCDEQAVGSFFSHVQADSTWLASRLEELEPNPKRFVLIDCPRRGFNLRSQAYALSDVIVVVLGADTLSYAALADLHLSMSLQDANKAVYLLNGFDPKMRLDCDIADLLRADHGAKLCPVAIHRDESVREALASKLSVNIYAPYSQAANDFSDLTTWLVGKLAVLHRSRNG